MLNLLRRSFTPDELVVNRFLNKCRLFQDLTNDELVLFIPHLHLRKYAEEEVVFLRNDPAQAIYLVKEGQVSLSIDMGGELEEIGRRRSFGSFGDNALVPNTRRIYNAIVQSEAAEIYVIPQVNLFDIFERRPAIQAKMMMRLTEVYEHYVRDLFYTYRNTQGFFQLGSVQRRGKNEK